MPRAGDFVVWSVALLLLTAACGAAAEQAAEKEKDQPAAQSGTKAPADKPADSPAADTKKEAAEPSEKVDPFEVPEGSVEEFLAFIDGIRTQRVRTVEELVKLNNALLTATERIQAAEPDKKQLEQALSTKLKALSALSRFAKTDDINAKMEEMPEEFKKAGLDDLVRDAARTVLQTKASDLRTAPEKEADELLQRITAFIQEGGASAADLGLAMSTGRAMESAGNADKAAKVCRDLAKLFAESEDEKVLEYVAKMEGAARRLQLPGNEMPLEGLTLDGEKLDWSKYAGKVVLVDFWATWCGFCLIEVPNIKKNYEAYHPRGFDVIGISIDKDRQTLEEFLEEHDYPWKVFWDPAAKEAEDLESMATRYGVYVIPTLVLIGADGKVVALNPRGPKLGEELAKLLGPLPEEKADEGEPEKDVKGKPAEAKEERSEEKKPEETN